MAMTPTRTPERSLSANDPAKRTRLRLARALALGLLVAAGLLYIFARLLMPRYPWLSYVAAFSQAAMVGALADWFAVVALFRHPLGIRLPHTAIISSNKTRIANNLGEFIQSRFLSTDKVLEGIRSFAPGRRLAKWAARPENRDRTLLAIRHGAAHIIAALDHEHVRVFVKETLTTQIEAWDISTLASQILGILSENRRYQWLLDEALTQFNQFLQQDDVRDELVRAIAKHMEYVPSTLNLDERLGRAILQRLYDALQTVLQAVRDDHDHVLRRRFDEAVRDIREKLVNDPLFRARVRAMQIEFVRHPETGKAFEYLWEELRHWLCAQLQEPHGPLSDRISFVIHDLAQSLTTHPRLAAWIDEQLLRYAPPLVERYRRTLGLFIAAQVKAWNDEFMVDQIELNIGRDLQFIRVNGTLVGGAVGLIIYAATQFFR
ncbi:MAG: DUF445 domain-containing protein [Acidiferrobacter sp.]